MASALLIARLVLAGVFAVAGLAKLADRAGTRESLERFGAPLQTVAVGALALPVVELAVAGALVPAGSARWGALAALVLLVVFSGAVARLLARGEEVHCNCFGSLGSKPADRRVLARNAGLGALGAFVAIAGWSDAGAQPGLGAAVGVLAAVALGGAAFAFLTLRQNGHLLLRVDAMQAEMRAGLTTLDPDDAAAAMPRQGLPVGTAVPDFTAHDMHGDPVTRDALLASGRPVALVFADADCPGCARLLPSLGPAAELRADEFDLWVLTSGSVAGARAMAAEHGLEQVLVQPAHALNLLLRAYALPSLLMIAPDGTVAEAFVKGPEAVSAALEGTPVPSPLRLEMVGG